MAYEEYKIIKGYVDLFKAIRNRAISDGFIDDFNSWWMDPPEMTEIWRPLRNLVYKDGV